MLDPVQPLVYKTGLLLCVTNNNKLCQTIDEILVEMMILNLLDLCNAGILNITPCYSIMLLPKEPRAICAQHFLAQS